MSKPIVVVGSANVDFIMQVPYLPKRGESVTDGSFMQTLGGKGANQAVAAARAGGQVVYVAAVGADAFGKQLVEAWSADGIDVSRVKVCEGVSCGTALIIYDGQGDNYLAVAPGANDHVLPADVDAARSLIEGAGAVVLQNEIPAETTARAMELAGECGVPAIFNYAPFRGGQISIDRELAVLVVNETEAAGLLGGEGEPEAMARALAARGPNTVIVTLGAEGSLVLVEGSALRVGAFPVAPVDTTAAGDTYCGALAVARTEGADWTEAVQFASAAAALCVTKAGAQPSIPKRAEIESFLEQRS